MERNNEIMKRIITNVEKNATAETSADIKHIQHEDIIWIQKSVSAPA